MGAHRRCQTSSGSHGNRYRAVSLPRVITRANDYPHRVIAAALVCPHPPLLLRELSGAEDAVPELRAACRSALVAALDRDVETVTVVGGADTSGCWDPDLGVEVAGFGTADAARVAGLPLSLGVGRRLLDEVGWTGPVTLRSVARNADSPQVAAVARAVTAAAAGTSRSLLLVLGDGGARRGEHAPGYLDERVFAFDDALVTALADGDGGALTRLDRALAEELMVLGRAAFEVLGTVVVEQGGNPRAQLFHRGDPHGVTYAVALWHLDGS